jgi:glucose-1-phosphate thymidylyltransferase
MKAIILVAGAGAKLRPHTYTQPKALFPIAGKTIIDFIVEKLVSAGVTNFIFVVGYLGEKILEYIKQNYPGLNCKFVYQTERHGTGHAIELTRSYVGDDEVFVVLGDTICEYDIDEVLNAPHNMLGVKKVDDPRNFGVAEINEEGVIDRVVEKPAIPKSNMALVGLYKIRDTQIMFQCLHHLFTADIRSFGEFNFTDALECMIQRGAEFKSFKVKNWYDCGRKETLLESNSTLLKKHGGQIHSTVTVDNAIIIPPVSIGANTVLRNSIIGPHVSIGANTMVQLSNVRDSIVGSYTNLYEVVLNDSVIGSDATVKGLSRSLNIGDNTEIDFG